jgi:hypothetical protein
MKNIKMYEDFDTSYDGWETTYSSKFEGHDRDEQNYMFFHNLMTIKDAIDDLMQILTITLTQFDAMIFMAHGVSPFLRR